MESGGLRYCPGGREFLYSLDTFNRVLFKASNWLRIRFSCSGPKLGRLTRTSSPLGVRKMSHIRMQIAPIARKRVVTGRARLSPNITRTSNPAVLLKNRIEYAR